MAADEDCTFCKSVAGKLPAERVDEDEHTPAFMDVNPWTRGHALVIPKRHSKNLYEVEADDLHHTASAAQRLQKKSTSASRSAACWPKWGACAVSGGDVNARRQPDPA